MTVPATDGSLLTTVVEYGTVKLHLQVQVESPESPDLAEDHLFGHLFFRCPNHLSDPNTVLVTGNLPLANPHAAQLGDDAFQHVQCVTLIGGFLPSTLSAIAPYFPVLDLIRIVPLNGQYVCFTPHLDARTLALWPPEIKEGANYMKNLRGHPKNQEYPSQLHANTQKLVINMEGRDVYAAKGYTFLHSLHNEEWPASGKGREIVVVADDLTSRLFGKGLPPALRLVAETMFCGAVAPLAKFTVVGLREVRHLNAKPQSRDWYRQASLMIAEERQDDADFELVQTRSLVIDKVEEWLEEDDVTFLNPEQYRAAVGARVDRLECVRDILDEQAWRARDARLDGPTYPACSVLDPEDEAPADEFFEHLVDEVTDIVREAELASVGEPGNGIHDDDALNGDA